MVLLGDLREQLERGAAVLVAVLHADLGEHAGHRVGADAAVHRADGAVAALGLVDLLVTLGLATRAEQTCAGKLLHADGEAHVHLAGFHGHDCRAQRRCTRGARVRHVVDGDTGLADLLLDLLTHAAAAHEVARCEDADVLHRHTAVSECCHGGLGREVHDVLVRVLAELGHFDPEDPDVVAGHGVLLSCVAVAGESSV